MGAKPEKIKVLLSANILKMQWGVGIPGTGNDRAAHRCGFGCVDREVRLSARGAERQYSGAVEEGKKLIDEKRICISLKEDITEKLYIEVTCEAGGEQATAIISGGHTTLCLRGKGR